MLKIISVLYVVRILGEIDLSVSNLIMNQGVGKMIRIQSKDLEVSLFNASTQRLKVRNSSTVKDLFKSIIRHGSLLYLTDSSIIGFYDSKMLYEELAEVFGRYRLPSHRILARACTIYLLEGRNVCYLDFQDMHSHSYLKNRLPWLSKMGYLAKSYRRTIPQYYYPNISLLMSTISGELPVKRSLENDSEVMTIVSNLNSEQLLSKCVSYCLGMHDLQICFYGLGVYEVLRRYSETLKRCGWKYCKANGEYTMPKMTFGRAWDFLVIFEPTGRVRVTVRCSNNPIKIPEDLEEFSQTLILLRTLLRNIIRAATHIDPDPITIPPPGTWIVKQLHLNMDLRLQYSKRDPNYNLNIFGFNKLFLRIYPKGDGLKRLEFLIYPNITMDDLLQGLTRLFREFSRRLS
ncbi:hypothetical protein DRN63_02745 [Nanoarchaeota archaeon]|nr:MAG: hypothetical protein DRN63_02745 [Nanoarchaeota archaeon]